MITMNILKSYLSSYFLLVLHSFGIALYFQNKLKIIFKNI